MNTLKKIGKFLFSMKFGILLLCIMILACIGGSIIPQGEISAYYTGYYPEKLGMLILLTGLNDVFHCTWFMILTILVCINLLGCNLRHFPLLVKRVRTGFTAEKRLASVTEETVPDAKLSKDAKAVSASAASSVPAHEALFHDLGFRKPMKKEINGKTVLYGVRNKIGLWGAWLTHLGMLIIIIGFALGQIATIKYTVYGVPGQTKQVGDTDYALTIDSFAITLREDSTVDQYTSDLTLTNQKTGESQSAETSVNHPASMSGMKFYQNSTGWAATVLVFEGEELIQQQILCAGEHLKLSIYDGHLTLAFNAFYPDLITGSDGNPATASSELNNPGYLYTMYYDEGVIGMNVLNNDYITLDDGAYTIAFVDPQQYTLIQVKRDPFTPVALVGGILIILAVFIAFYTRTEELLAVPGEDGSWNFYGSSRKGAILFHESIENKAKKYHGQKKEV